MDDAKKCKVLMAAVAAHLKGEFEPLNSPRFEVRLARLMSSPEFRGLGVTLREGRELYREICEMSLNVRMAFRRQ